MALRERFAEVSCCNPLRKLVRLAGFEPAAYGLEVRCSIRLSYRRKDKLKPINTISSYVSPL